MTTDSSTFLSALGVFETAEKAAEDTLVNLVGGPETTEIRVSDELARRAELLEHEAFSEYITGTAAPADTSAFDESREIFSRTFDCWLAIELHSLGTIDCVLPPLTQDISIALRLAVAGLAGGRVAETRMQLRRRLPPANPQASGLPHDAQQWPALVTSGIAQSIIWLIRKSDGWLDIDAALQLLRSLRSWQDVYERDYLASVSDEVASALDLVGFYYVAQVATSCAEYLVSGDSAYDGLVAKIDRYHDQALSISERTSNAHLRHFADLVWVACRELARNSIWSQISGLGDQVARLAASLASRTRNSPVLELWPSQQRALSSSLLDPYRRAVLVEMPTSAGKTMLAKFAIMQTKNLHREGVVAYIVPTRALVNQVTFDLREDLGPLGISIEPTVSAFELDPVEDALLAQAPDVLISTPEKLDLFLRRDHPCTRDLSMVVVDEAHNLSDKGRGARLELVLSTIRRDKPNVRFLMLSPFMPRADNLVEWLGGDRYLPPIAVNWKPGRKVVGALQVTGRGRDRKLQLETLDAVANSDLKPGRKISLGPVSEPADSVKAVSRIAASRLRERGNTLILCWGPRYAMDRAKEVADQNEEVSGSLLRDAVCDYIAAELGPDSALPKYLRRGVAYHHAGLPHETRWLIENLVKRGEIHTVCGTTTLAQGVNFPISNVIIEDRRKGRGGKLSYSDLWNIAGRAGRALLDDVGVVGFPVKTQEQRESWQSFLRDDAIAVSSQLAEVVAHADEIGENFTVDMVARIPALGDLLQFLAHAIRVSGYRHTADEVEDLVRSSLIYHESRKADRAASIKLVRLCRSYLEKVSGRPGIVALSDQTGFSTPSISKLMAVERSEPSLRSERDWSPSVLFDPHDDRPLTARIRTVADVPEMDLGSEYSGNFNPQRVAQILQGWVNGDSISDLAARYGDPRIKDSEKKLADFASYLNGRLLSQISWGLGALATVCLGGEQRPTDAAVPELSRHVPSMVFFGVNTPEAIGLRMAGAPRLVARGLANILPPLSTRPQAMTEIRSWIRNLRVEDWDRVVAGDRINGRSMQLIWHELFT